MYTYICIYIHMYMYVYVYNYIYVLTAPLVSLSRFWHMYQYVLIHILLQYMHGCPQVWYIYLCLHVYIWVSSALIHVSMSTCICMGVLRFDTCIYTCRHTYTIYLSVCRMLSLLQGSFTKETYNFIDPTNQSHPIHVLTIYLSVSLFMSVTFWINVLIHVSKPWPPYSVTPIQILSIHVWGGFG